MKGDLCDNNKVLFYHEILSQPPFFKGRRALKNSLERVRGRVCARGEYGNRPDHFKNPATLEEIARLKPTSPDEVRRKVEEGPKGSSLVVFPFLRGAGGFMRKAREYILENLDEIARTISQDNGKPLVEAISSDILPVCDLLAYFSKNTEKLLRAEKINIGVMGFWDAGLAFIISLWGSSALSSPWNFPFSIPMSGTVMALMAGNCVLLKPADATPLVGNKIEEIFNAAGLPSVSLPTFPAAPPPAKPW